MTIPPISRRVRLSPASPFSRSVELHNRQALVKKVRYLEAELNLLRGRSEYIEPQHRISPVNAKVQVLMSTYNGSQWIKRSLDSIEESLAGMSWVLVIGVDGLDDATVNILQNHHSSSDHFFWQVFSKAPTVSKAKNRVLSMGRRMFPGYEWVMEMDDDDVMYRERVTHLLANAIQYGHRLACGDWVVDETALGKGIHTVSAITSAHKLQWIPPCCTVWHLSVLDEAGPYKDTAPGQHEDVDQQWRRRHLGINMAAFPGPPVLRQIHCRKHSASRPADVGQGEAHHRASNQIAELRKIYPPRPFFKSICSAAFGDNPMMKHEARVLYESIRMYMPDMPVLVACDDQFAAEFKDPPPNVKICPMVTGKLRRYAADEFARFVKYAPTVRAQDMIGKFVVIPKAIEDYGDTLYVDNDFFFTGLPNQRVTAPMALSPHYYPSGFGDWKHYGWFNGGMMYLQDAGALSYWWEQMHDERFCDQKCLEDLFHYLKCEVISRSNNVGNWRGEFSFSVGDGIYLDGYQVQSMHTHLFGIPGRDHPRINKFNKQANDAMRASQDVRHQQLHELINSLYERRNSDTASR